MFCSLIKLNTFRSSEGFPQTPCPVAQFQGFPPPLQPYKPRLKCPISESTLCTFTILQELKGKSEMDFCATSGWGAAGAQE